MQGDFTMNTAAQAIAIGALLILGADRAAADEPAGARHRVLVSTDIGGTDPDDFSRWCICSSMPTASTSRGWSRRRSARAGRSTSSASSTATSRITPT